MNLRPGLGDPDASGFALHLNGAGRLVDQADQDLASGLPALDVCGSP
jgi:hypothetical protein